MMVPFITRQITTTISGGVTRSTITTISQSARIMEDILDVTVGIIQALTTAVIRRITVLTPVATVVHRRFISDERV